MKLNVYTIFDTATGAHMRPFFLHADAQAARMFGDICADKEHEVGKHPEDYSLCRIGVWDDQSAQMTNEGVDVLVTGLECMSAERNNAVGTVDLQQQEKELSNGE